MFCVVFPIVLRVSIGGVVDEMGFGFEGSQPVTRAVAIMAVAIDAGIDLYVMPIEDSSVNGGDSSAQAALPADKRRIPAPGRDGQPSTPLPRKGMMAGNDPFPR